VGKLKERRIEVWKFANRGVATFVEVLVGEMDG
jgi:hypothetical protein